MQQDLSKKYWTEEGRWKGNSQFSAEDVLTIRMLGDGRLQHTSMEAVADELAKVYGCGIGTIRNILKRKTFRNIPEENLKEIVRLKELAVESQKRLEKLLAKPEKSEITQDPVEMYINATKIKVKPVQPDSGVGRLPFIEEDKK